MLGETVVGPNANIKLKLRKPVPAHQMSEPRAGETNGIFRLGDHKAFDPVPQRPEALHVVVGDAGPVDTQLPQPT